MTLTAFQSGNLCHLCHFCHLITRDVTWLPGVSDMCMDGGKVGEKWNHFGNFKHQFSVQINILTTDCQKSLILEKSHFYFYYVSFPFVDILTTLLPIPTPLRVYSRQQGW